MLINNIPDLDTIDQGSDIEVITPDNNPDGY